MSKPLHYIHESLPVFIAETNMLSARIQGRSVSEQDQDTIEAVLELVVLGVVVTLCLLLAWGGV